ncbi:MAG TPA: Mur ligase family protein [Chitinispirillaceae bacterium]|nr:Mur ligase family protein [Chitinispirillaceae bacterium]
MSLLINNTPCNSIHFAGILGSGMSALAQFSRWMGLSVSGSDRMLESRDTAAMKKGLQETGCILYPQDGSGVNGSTDAVCVSTAIEDSNPDIAAARELNIPVIHRSDLLSAIISTRKTIAVAGTSGKSTVTAMIFEFLSHCGKSPSLISGASLLRLQNDGLIGNAYYGKSDLLVVEADESDGSLVKYSPYISVFLNISKDHKPVPEILKMFSELVSRSQISVINADDAGLGELRADLRFSIHKEADFSASDIEFSPCSSSMTLGSTRFCLPIPGEHNLSNCAAALGVCRYLGCDESLLSEAVSSYKGVARRFSILHTAGGITVVDDFAHNPEKIKAAVKASRGISQRLFIIYQPHGFGPTRFLKDEYVEVFRTQIRPEDTLYLLPIYYAGGTAQKDISSSDIINALGSVAFEASAPESREALLEKLKRSVVAGDCILLMGARDPSLSSFASQIASLFGGVKTQTA